MSYAISVCPQDDCKVLREGVRYMFSDRIDRESQTYNGRKMYQKSALCNRPALVPISWSRQFFAL